MTNPQLTARIRQIRRELCGDDNTVLAARIGKSRQHASQLCSGASNAGQRTIVLLLDAFPSVSPEWLTLGIGPMFRSRPDTPIAAADIYADIADTLAHLSALFSRLAQCAPPSES